MKKQSLSRAVINVITRFVRGLYVAFARELRRHGCTLTRDEKGFHLVNKKGDKKSVKTLGDVEKHLTNGMR